MKGSMGHFMGWLDTFCWPMGHIQVKNRGSRRQKSKMCVFSNFWSPVDGYGGPWSNYLGSWGGRQSGSCDGLAEHLLMASEMHLCVL